MDATQSLTRAATPDEPKPRRYKVVLADDHPFILFALEQLILADGQFEAAGRAGSGWEALTLIRSARPDVAVVDVAMPKLNGILLARKVREEGLVTKIVMLTAYEDDAHLKQALAAGANAYVVKRAATESLIPALRAVIAGGTFVDPMVVARLGPAKHSPDATGLTDRERDVLRLSALGHSTKDIARLMAIGVKSVETYRSRAGEKLGLHSKVDLVRFAIAEGWLA